MSQETQGFYVMELLTVEEFAERMKISRTTVFDWIRKGTLKIGRHYFKMGRVIRFEWGPELIHKLHEDSVTGHGETARNPLPRPPMSIKDRRSGNGRVAINLDC